VGYIIGYIRNFSEYGVIYRNMSFKILKIKGSQELVLHFSAQLWRISGACFFSFVEADSFFTLHYCRDKEYQPNWSVNACFQWKEKERYSGI
jgi:hypothetical protein